MNYLAKTNFAAALEAAGFYAEDTMQDVVLVLEMDNMFVFLGDFGDDVRYAVATFYKNKDARKADFGGTLFEGTLQQCVEYMQQNHIN